MQAAAAPDAGPVARARALDDSLARAHQLAVAQGHSTVALEHLLFALQDDPDAQSILDASGVGRDRLGADVSAYVGRLSESSPAAPGVAPRPGADLLRILQLATMAARQSQRRQMDGAIVLAAIIGDGNSPAAGMLKAQGLTFDAVIRAITQSAPPRQAEIEPEPQRSALPAPPLPTSPPREHPASRIGRVPEGPSADDMLAAARARVRQSEPPTVPIRTAPVAPPPKPKPKPEPVLPPPPPTVVAIPEQPVPVAASPDVASAPVTQPDAPAEPVPTSRPPAVVSAVPADQPRSPQTSATIPPPPPIHDLAEPPPPNSAALAEPQAPRPSSLPPVAIAPPTYVPEPQPGPALAALRRTPVVQGSSLPTPALPGSSAQRPPLPPTAIPPPVLHQPAGVAPPPMPMAPLPPPPPLPPFAPSAVATHRHPPQAPIAPAPPPAAVPPQSLVPAEPLDIVAAAAGLPASLRLGTPVLVEVRIPRNQVDVPRRRGSQGMGMAGEPPLYRVVTTRLGTGGVSGLAIEPRSPETIWLGMGRDMDGADIVWQFVVTPTRRGRFAVSLAVSGRTVSPYGVAGDGTPLTETFAVIVKAPKGSRFKGVVTGLGLFGLGAAVALVAGAPVLAAAKVLLAQVLK